MTEAYYYYGREVVGIDLHLRRRPVRELGWTCFDLWRPGGR